jgi:hypothetical protein
MRARIYRPARSATQSGPALSRQWVLEFTPEAPREVDPLMGWTSSGDMRSQIRLRFDSREAAEAYAREHGLEAVVIEPKPRRPTCARAAMARISARIGAADLDALTATLRWRRSGLGFDAAGFCSGAGTCDRRHGPVAQLDRAPVF